MWLDVWQMDKSLWSLDCQNKNIITHLHKAGWHIMHVIYVHLNITLMEPYHIFLSYTQWWFELYKLQHIFRIHQNPFLKDQGNLILHDMTPLKSAR